MKSKLKNAAYILLIFTFFSSCNAFRDSELGVYQEAPKDINGVWQLKTVSRNLTDITHTMDFSRFRLNLNEDGSYTIDNYLPFAVKKNGQWRVDDPQYPFHLIFHEEGSGEDVSINLLYPISQGKRFISVTVSPGCSGNLYTYVFEKIDNNK